MLIKIAKPEMARLVHIPDLRYDTRAGVVLGLEGRPRSEGFVCCTNGLLGVEYTGTLHWYSFKSERDIEELLKRYNSGDLTVFKGYELKKA